jgi:hypothetical protein
MKSVRYERDYLILALQFLYKKSGRLSVSIEWVYVTLAFQYLYKKCEVECEY